MKTEKILGEERRVLILDELKKSTNPMTGGELATLANVSRQVIVQDISLLKAKNHPIMATSQGYVYLASPDNQTKKQERIIACKHSPEHTADELTILVDHGVFVKDVIIEHPVYGDLTASIMVGNRNDVKEFIAKINANNASYLSELTEGIHLHTLQADSVKQLDLACAALEKEGYLFKG
ncbi:transcription repressor NadR [Bacillus weihaiensis]|uniref:Transcriptional regulator n=1 Tax=Bacillus weihaiensis TaxID=1547283 RepID=A0A1L3MPR9_9BACI|nr:transcription repressor NadR [Bacillus weihaiensis]APH04244.1 transcriptional regulator [Bacillus weihaiensis]